CARRPPARCRPLGAARARRPRDAGRGGPSDRAPERLAHRPGRRAHQGRLDRQGLRQRAQRPLRQRWPRRPGAGRAARPRRRHGAPARPAAVALHHRSHAALRRRDQRGAAPHHRPARPRPAAQVTAMDLALAQDQQAIQSQARRFLAAEITRERRLAWDATPEGHDAAFWTSVAALGWFGFALPEAAGGQGGTLVELGLLLEECGRAVAPLGVFAAIAGGLALDALGTEQQRREWLPTLARGERMVTLAVAERRAAREPAAFETMLARRGGGVRL